MTKTGLLTYGAALALSLGATVASAAVTECPAGPATNTLRVFTTTTTPAAVCWDYDEGNSSNMPTEFIALPGPGTGMDGKFQLPTGYVLLDKSDDTTSGSYDGLLTGTSNGANGDLTDGLSGTFTITLPSTYQYLIVFKSGQGQANPDWAAFLLPLGVLTGNWSISGQQQLSHAEIYGRNVVPLPAAAWLLGSGLLGLLAVGRRRKSAQVAAA